MISAHLVMMPDGSYMVRLMEVQGTRVIFQRTITPDDASFLVMDIDEVIKEIRMRPPTTQ